MRSSSVDVPAERRYDRAADEYRHPDHERAKPATLPRSDKQCVSTPNRNQNSRPNHQGSMFEPASGRSRDVRISFSVIDAESRHGPLYVSVPINADGYGPRETHHIARHQGDLVQRYRPLARRLTHVRVAHDSMVWVHGNRDTEDLVLRKIVIYVTPCILVFPRTTPGGNEVP